MFHLIINFPGMNCNKNARIQFALHLLIVDHMSYTCTSFQWFAGLNWTTYSQAFYLGESQVRFVVPRRPFAPRRLVVAAISPPCMAKYCL